MRIDLCKRFHYVIFIVIVLTEFAELFFNMFERLTQFLFSNVFHCNGIDTLTHEDKVTISWIDEAYDNSNIMERVICDMTVHTGAYQLGATFLLTTDHFHSVPAVYQTQTPHRH